MSEYSIKMQEIFSVAQYQVARFESLYLESWHVLLAIVVVHGSVAGLAFAEYQTKVAYEEHGVVAVLAIGESPLTDVDGAHFVGRSEALSGVLIFAEFIYQVTGGNGTRMKRMLCAMLLNLGLLTTRLLRVAGLKNKEGGDTARLVDLRKDLACNIGFTRENIKAAHEPRRPKKSTMDGASSEMMKPQSITGDLSDFTHDSTEMIRQRKLESVIGREKEISRMVQVLNHRTKNNPASIGEAGVDRTALAYGPAQRIVSGTTPYELQDTRVLKPDMMNIVVGTRPHGNLEKRMSQTTSDIGEDGHATLPIDEVRTVMGSGSGIDSTLDVANTLEPVLMRGTLHTVSAMTQEGYQKYLERDATLSCRFAKIAIEEPSAEDAYQILLGLKRSYEDFHNVVISDETVLTVVKVAHHYLISKNPPDSVIDLLDEAGTTIQGLVKKEVPAILTSVDKAILEGDFKLATKLLKESHKKPNRKPTTVTEDDITAALNRLSGTPVEKMTQADSKKYLNLERELHRRVTGQDSAISAISRAVRYNQAGIRIGKHPVGSLTFSGPAGVGKAGLAKALTGLLSDDESALIHFDMSEYIEKSMASCPNEAPPGHAGHEEGDELTEKVRNKPYSVLLFDEIERAHPDIFNVFFQVLNDGVLANNRDRKIDFSDTIIIMTLSLEAAVLRDEKTVGFGVRDMAHDCEATQRRIMEELKKAHRSEFINHIDEKIVFHNLTQENMRDVVKIMAKSLTVTLAEKDITLKFQPSVLEYLVEIGYGPGMGAHPLRRTLRDKVEDELSELILSGELASGNTLKIGASKG